MDDKKYPHHVRYLLEREQERNLVSRTRDVTMPDGRVQKVTMYEVFWVWLDRLRENTDYNLEKVVEMTVRSMKETGRDFFLELEIMIYFLVKSLDNYGFDVGGLRGDIPQLQVVKEIMLELYEKKKDE